MALFSTATNAFAQDGAWLRAETPGFIVYSTGAETRVRGVAEDLEAFDALLRRMTQTTAPRSPTKLEIYLFNGPGQYQEAFPGDSSSIRGRYGARPDIIAAYAIFEDRVGMGAQDVLFHEYAHHFMYQYFANIYPAWYVEGFAEFASTVAFEDNRIVIGRVVPTRADWLRSGSFWFVVAYGTAHRGQAFRWRRYRTLLRSKLAFRALHLPHGRYGSEISELSSRLAFGCAAR